MIGFTRTIEGLVACLTMSRHAQIHASDRLHAAREGSGDDANPL